MSPQHPSLKKHPVQSTQPSLVSSHLRFRLQSTLLWLGVFGFSLLVWFLGRSPSSDPASSAQTHTPKTGKDPQPQTVLMQNQIPRVVRPHDQPQLIVLPPLSATQKPMPLRAKSTQHGQPEVSASLLRTSGKRWGTLADGTTVYTLSSRYKNKHPHPHAHEGETPEGGQLWTVDKSGKLHRMLPGIATTEVVIAPSSERLAVVSNQRGLFVSSPHAHDSWQHLSNRAGYDPAFDATGERLLYTEQQNLDQQQLRLRRLTANQQEALLTQKGGISSPCFHPDGHAVIFASGQTGIMSLWKLTLQTEKLEQLTNRGLQGGGGLPPNFVPPPYRGRILWAGSWLVFDTGDALWALRDNGTQPTIIAQESPEWFRWSLPGRQILYQLQKSQERVYHLPH